MGPLRPLSREDSCRMHALLHGVCQAGPLAVHCFASAIFFFSESRFLCVALSGLKLRDPPTSAGASHRPTRFFCSYLLLTFYLFLTWVGICLCWPTRGGQKTTCASRFSPSTVSALGIEPWLSAIHTPLSILSSLGLHMYVICKLLFLSVFSEACSTWAGTKLC